MSSRILEKASEMLPGLGQGSCGSVPMDMKLSPDDYYTGTVKCWFGDKVYGFIELPDGGLDVFVHANQLRRSGITHALKPGDKVRFKTNKGPKGFFAIDISLIP